MHELTINPKFHNLIPPISSEEYQLLEESILNEGCREAIVTWNDCILDGHNRYEICQKHGIGFHCLEKDCDDEEEATIWIVCNQLGRRNLTPAQMSNLRGIRYNLEKKEHGGQIPGSRSDQNDQSTAEHIAKETGVSAPTIRRDAKFAEALDKLTPEEKMEVLAGKSKKTKKEIMGSPKNKDWVVPKNKKIGPPSVGMQFARMAIMDLEKIEKDDLERDQAFNFVSRWIKNNQKEENNNGT